MIVTRAPLRLPFGGGGTDITSYSSRFGGFIISAAIDKYVYISINKPQADDLIRLKYSRSECVKSVDEIENEMIKEALRLVGIERSIEVTAMADLPDGTGLGSSGSFLVALLLGLHRFKNEVVSAQQLAEEASHIEIDILGHPIGKHDQYVAAVGGITILDIDKENKVNIVPSMIKEDTIRDLENHLSLYYTGVLRRSNEVLKKQDKSTRENVAAVVDSLHSIKKIGLEINRELEAGNVTRIGSLFDKHWQSKIKLSKDVAGARFTEIYDTAISNGAAGGKLIGAGGGGFFTFFANGSKTELRGAMSKAGLLEVPMRFEPEGAKILIDF